MIVVVLGGVKVIGLPYSMVFIMVRTNTVANYKYSTAAGIFTTTTLRSVQYYCT
jgi:hypothetical protein